MPSTVALPDLAETILSCDDFVVCGHVSPDGDCLGSGLALVAALRSIGKRATMLLASSDPLEWALSQLPGMEEAVCAKDFTGDFDAFVTVDVPSSQRLGEAAAALHARAAHTFTIDHHISDAPLSDATFVDEDSPATALIVWDLVALLGAARTPEIASCCYAGLMTDTGRFQYQNTTPRALEAASEMVFAGADPAEISQLFYQNRSVASLALERRMIERIEFPCDGQFALSHLLISDFAETGADRSDAEDLIDVLRSVRGARVACLLREQESTVRGSLRAKDDTDVAEIARSIGGGGHKAAAGFTFEGTMKGALDCIRSAFSEIARGC